MSSNKDKNSSTNSSKEQNNRFGKQISQTLTTNQQEHSATEGPGVLNYWNKNKNELEKRYGSLQLARLNPKKRMPRYYSVNQHQTLLVILQGDIVQTKVDAIVNAANEGMTGGAGVDGIIHRAAGRDLYNACKAHKQVERGVRLPTGHSRILLSYNMSATTYYIINTAGPVYDKYQAEACAEELSSCYKTALQLANLYDLESIGFTAISCGIFGYPANDGAEVALRSVYTNAGSMPVVVFVLWDDHIYDAWIKKAEELEFTPFDPESAAIKNCTEPSTNNEEKSQTSEQSNQENDKQESQTTFNPHLKDDSTSNETGNTPEESNQNLVTSVPSVSDEPSDSQRTEILESDDNPMDVDQNLPTQTTVRMDSVDTRQHNNLTTNNVSEQQSSQDETTKSDNENVTIDDKSHKSIVQKETEKTDAQSAKTETTHDEHH
ncbi:unnamed protein product [Adineta steineri]|uniref:Macro domain-containing protein n=1 Tax=Adineta steineri TaxID=433720 RepID=A0A814ZUS2_9BILA|nr:unnamed protein product [Adineta steineri]